jgi:TolB protein
LCFQGIAMKRKAARLALMSFVLFGTPLGAQSPIGMFDSQSDVGSPRRPGSASYAPGQQSYVIAGSGQNMWGDHDDFHFVWKRMSGNFIPSTRARFIGAGVDPHRKIGWTIRPSLETRSPHVTAALHGNGLMSLQFRRAAGGTTEEEKSRDSLPNADAVIQLERRDGVYIMSVARFGDTLATQELTGVSLPDTVYVGLFVCAHNDTVTERAAFTNVRITKPPRRARSPTAITSAAISRFSTSRAAMPRLCTATAARSRRPTGRRTGRH